MSTIPELYYYMLSMKRALTNRSSQSATPTSIICPVASATLAAYTNDIYMDHDRLPPMRPFTIGTETVNGHDLQSEFVYICRYQFAQGTFHLVGESGLFSVGFATLALYPTIPHVDIGLEIVRPDGFSHALTLKGCEQRSVFLGKGDYFRLFCTLPEESEAFTLNGLASNFTITRLSKNTGYAHPAPVPT